MPFINSLTMKQKLTLLPPLTKSREGKNYLKKFLTDEGISIDFEKCLNNKNIEDYVLNDRIEGVKKFNVDATPTIIINDKKFDKALNYKNLKKYLEKLI